MTYREIWFRLADVYSDSEAKAIARYVLEMRYGLTFADILSGKADGLPDGELKEIVGRLADSEPVQYVLGRAEFAGRMFKVAPGVLIPRPETAGLCEWIMSDVTCGGTVLDIGTGSGCIAITLALGIPQSEVTAWDISETAVAITKENSRTLNADVTVIRQDALSPPSDTGLWDIVVSNPPYICDKERVLMERNVLYYEPHTALFVPDDNPLMFYRAIASYSLTALKQGGALYFEINPLYANELSVMLQAKGFKEVCIRRDQFDKERFIKAVRS